MIISIASGKGGTGKTTVSASLVSVWDSPVVAVDLDVEEPNLHLYLKPAITSEEPVHLETPRVNEDICTRCGACSDICQFKAITLMGPLVMTFPEMCHGCGGCFAVCPVSGALSVEKRQLGVVAEGQAGENLFLMGRLRVGEAMSPPLMRAVKKRLTALLGERPGQTLDAVIDAPPGVSCPAMNAVMDSDAVVLVTEPTPFGFHDFKLAHEAFTPLGKPMGAVINRSGLGDDSVFRYCREQNIPVLAEIPYDRAIAEAYSRGEVVADVSAELASAFENLRDAVREMAQGAEGRRAHA